MHVPALCCRDTFELASSGVSGGGALNLLAHVGRLAVELSDDVAVSVALVAQALGAVDERRAVLAIRRRQQQRRPRSWRP